MGGTKTEKMEESGSTEPLPTTTILDNEITMSFDHNAPKYHCLGIHSLTAVYIHTIICYVYLLWIAFVVAVDIGLHLVSKHNTNLWSQGNSTVLVMGTVSLAVLVEAASKHLALKTEKEMWMVPSLCIWPIVMSFMVVAFIGTLSIPIVGYESMHKREKEMLRMFGFTGQTVFLLSVLLNLVVLITFALFICVIQWKFCDYLSDKRRFSARACPTTVVGPLVDASTVEEQPDSESPPSANFGVLTVDVDVPEHSVPEDVPMESGVYPPLAPLDHWYSDYPPTFLAGLGMDCVQPEEAHSFDGSCRFGYGTTEDYHGVPEGGSTTEPIDFSSVEYADHMAWAQFMNWSNPIVNLPYPPASWCPSEPPVYQPL